MTDGLPERYWNSPAPDILRSLGSTADGQTAEEAARRLETFGPNLLKKKRRTDTLALLLGQFKGPIILILIFAAVLS